MTQVSVIMGIVCYVYTVRYCSFLFFVCVLILSVCYLLITTLLGE